MLTEESRKRNLKSAANLARKNAELASVEPANFNYAQRLLYNREFSKIILAYPKNFSQIDIFNAKTVLNQNDSPLADSSVAADLKTFSDEFVSQALDVGDAVGDIGRGVKNTARLAAIGIPLFVAILAAVFIFRQIKKPR